MREVVMVSAARTAVGTFGGALAGLSAAQIGQAAAAEAVRRASHNG